MEQAKEFLLQFSGPESYLLFYITLLGCGIGLPMNSDLLIIAASVLAAFGYFKLSLLIPVAFFGLLSGDSINYWVARIYGPKILSIRPFSWVIAPEKLKVGEAYLNRNGTRFIFLVRFLPLIRTVLYFTAGSLQVRPRTFYLLNAASTVIYLIALMEASFYAAANIDPLIATFKQIQFFLLGGVVLIAAILLIRKKMKRPIPS